MILALTPMESEQDCEQIGGSTSHRQREGHFIKDCSRLERKVYIALFGLIQILPVEVHIEVEATVSSPGRKLNSLKC